jgi:AraC family transcriptional regulator of adaptative response / DNA-3-methyladenine glycosylase II
MSENGEPRLAVWFIVPPMQLEPDACYRATRARDARFDGRFFVGITSTRIYCRPVCGARPARRENQRYFASAAAAERSGFRPCLLCRPELAPGLALIDASRQLARAAASLIDDGVASEGGLDSVARRLGVTDRHLRRVFETEYGVTPVAYAQTARLLLAKRLLTDTRMPVTDVALAAGFGSVRRFNTLFVARYRLQPTALRRSGPLAASVDSHRFVLATRAPFDYPRLLGFFAARALAGVEQVDGRRLRRSLTVQGADGRPVSGWIEVRPSPRGAGIEARIDARLGPALPRVLAACKRAFDLDCQPDAVSASLGALAAARPGLRLPGAFDGFETAVRTILGQQISVKAARTLAGRLVETFGARLATPFAGVTRLFPDPRRIAGCAHGDIARLGVIAARAKAIVALAEAVAEGRIDLSPGVDVEGTVAALQDLPGIGAWTAQAIAMRALHWPDAFPAGDVGIARALGEHRPARLARVAESWRPWRAYAVMHLWSSLETKS